MSSFSFWLKLLESLSWWIPFDLNSLLPQCLTPGMCAAVEDCHSDPAVCRCFALVEGVSLRIWDMSFGDVFGITHWTIRHLPRTAPEPLWSTAKSANGAFTPRKGRPFREVQSTLGRCLCGRHGVRQWDFPQRDGHRSPEHFRGAVWTMRATADRRTCMLFANGMLSSFSWPHTYCGWRKSMENLGNIWRKSVFHYILSALLEKVLIFAHVSPCKHAPGQNAPNRGCRFQKSRGENLMHNTCNCGCFAKLKNQPTSIQIYHFMVYCSRGTQVVDGDSFSWTSWDDTGKKSKFPGKKSKTLEKYNFTGKAISGSPDPLVPWSSGPLVPWSLGLLVPGSSWSPGPLLSSSWSFTLLILWSPKCSLTNLK